MWHDMAQECAMCNVQHLVGICTSDVRAMSCPASEIISLLCAFESTRAESVLLRIQQLSLHRHGPSLTKHVPRRTQEKARTDVIREKFLHLGTIVLIL